jgi:hypothetical protein
MKGEGGHEKIKVLSFSKPSPFMGEGLGEGGK